jgi:gliding motility-associated-like protein
MQLLEVTNIMKKIKIFICLAFLCFGTNVFSQIISINDASDPESEMSLQDLVEKVLIGGECAEVDTFSEQVFGQPTDGNKSYGFFRKPLGSNFPFESGVVLSTGNASRAGNNLNGAIVSSNNGLPGDADLEAALSSIASFDITNDATFIKFNFVPTSSNFRFRFLMASEEYDGATECQFADGFAFLLREVGTTLYTNLAVLPDGTPVSVTNINNSFACSANTNYFEGYNLGDTNYGGRTVVLTASTIVDPSKTYEIKLVVADEEDFIWDSAIFLEAGSFNLGLDLGDDLTIAGGNPACDASSITLDTQIPLTQADHTWYLDGVEIPGETNSTLVVTTDGEYSVLVEYNSNCTATDTRIIQFTNSPIANPIVDQLICDSDNNGFWDFDLLSLNVDILGGQSAADFTITYHSSQLNADNNANALPQTYTNQIGYQTETLFVRIENKINPDCYDTTSFAIDVFDQPSTQPIIFNICDNTDDGDDTNGLVTFDLSTQDVNVLGIQNPAQFNITYHENQGDADANNNVLPNLYTNTSINSQDIYVRLENVDNTDCYSTSILKLVVNPLPVVTPIVTLRQCDTDADGFTDFNLTQANSLVSTNSSNEIFTFYLMQTEAESGLVADQIVNFTNYPNPVAINSVVYVRVETTFGCYRTAQIDLVVGATQIPQAFNLIYEICDDTLIDNDNTNGIAAFDFSDATAQVEGLFPSGQNLSITYYTTEADALSENNAIPDISNHRNLTSANVQQIYIRVDSDDVNACLGLGSHITLTVNPLPLDNQITDYILCSDTNETSFDLNTKTPEVIGTQSNALLISYHLSEQDAINNIPIVDSSSYTNISNPQLIYVRAQFDENGNGIGDSNECFSTDMSFELVVNPNPIVFTPDSIRICSDQINTIYDLTERKDQITGGDSSIILSYFETQADLDSNTPILDPTTYTSLMLNNFILVLATGTNGCTSVVIQELQTILYADLNVSPTFIEECEIDNNGFDFFDITRRETEILNGLDANDFTFTYYQQESDAIAGNTNNIADVSNFENTIINRQIIYVRVQPTTNECYIVVAITLIVNPVPEIEIEDEYVICLDNSSQVIDPPENLPFLPIPPIDTQLNETDYSFQWFNGTEDQVNIDPSSYLIPGATMSTYYPQTPGDYTVLATNIVTGCRIPASTVVVGSFPPESISVELLSPAFSDNNVLEVTVIGNGEYEFRLDDGNWQSSNTFENVNGGEHVIYVRDLLNCDEISTIKIVVDYLRFFTPNNDGYFDTWNIKGIETQPNAIIYIFDRYGKLLKQISPTGLGWDGTYNGDRMPESDYWFVVEYDEPLDNIRRHFRAHFALKR